MVILRPYQNESIEQMRQSLARGSESLVLQMATGGGKTSVASQMIQSAVDKGHRVFFIVDSVELIDQAAGRFEADGLDVGVIQGFHWKTDYSKPVQVATIQSLKNRWEYLHGDLLPGLVIIDECHVLHNAHTKIINQCKHEGVKVIGLSATPFRKGLGKVFDDLVVGATTKTLTDAGYLVPAKCYSVHVPDLKGIKSSGGDWQSDALAEVMGDAELVGDVVDHWLKHANGRKTIVFASNVAHSKFLCEEFRSRGVAANHIDGYMRDPLERETIIDDFRHGGTDVLCNVAVLTKGFDAPECSCVVLARPTKSLMLHIQMIGRGLRLAEGKDDCLILDHAGNILRNGLPTDELPAELDDGTLRKNLDRKQKEKTLKECACSSCGFVSTMHKCPACGFAPERREDVEVVNGELVEITDTPKAAERRNKAETRDQKAGFYSGLCWYAKNLGYKSGWAAHQYRDRYGVWPNAHKDVTAFPPSKEVVAWIKHTQIKKAKGRAA